MPLHASSFVCKMNLVTLSPTVSTDNEKNTLLKWVAWNNGKNPCYGHVLKRRLLMRILIVRIIRIPSRPDIRVEGYRSGVLFPFFLSFSFPSVCIIYTVCKRGRSFTHIWCYTPIPAVVLVTHQGAGNPGSSSWSSCFYTVLRPFWVPPCLHPAQVDQTMVPSMWVIL